VRIAEGLQTRNDSRPARRLTGARILSICAGFPGATGSHSRKTKRTFLPNLQNVTLISDALGRQVKLRVSTNGLRSVEHVGGLDNWLLKTADDKLSLKARRLKREVSKKQSEPASA